jgi:hypothetical protein
MQGFIWRDYIFKSMDGQIHFYREERRNFDGGILTSRAVANVGYSKGMNGST